MLDSAVSWPMVVANFDFPDPRDQGYEVKVGKHLFESDFWGRARVGKEKRERRTRQE